MAVTNDRVVGWRLVPGSVNSIIFADFIHPWMLLAPAATASAYAFIVDTAWVYGEKSSGRHTTAVTTVTMYAATLVAWAALNA